jgi:hypothetical protein
MNDIDLSEFLKDNTDGWFPIGAPSGSFHGHLHGNGYKISNLFIHLPETDNVGFIRELSSGATIDNLGLIIAPQDSVSGQHHVGGLVGRMRTGTISSCYVDGIVAGCMNVGGLAGNQSDEGIIDYCHTTGRIAGYRSGLFNGYCVGGLVGAAGGIVTNSYSTSIVNSIETVGGLIGSSSATVSACYATGTVISWPGNTYIGGLIGSNSGDIRLSYSSGNVQAQCVSAGGFTGGNSGNIINCYERGDVFQNSNYLNVGGLSGSAGKLLQYCYATGRVESRATGQYDLKRLGLAGSGNLENIIDCHFDKQATGCNYGLYKDGNYLINGNTTAEMMQKSTYENWNFETVWDIKEGETYPFFRWETERKSLLKSITLDKGALSPLFSPGTFEYTLNVPVGADRVNISALAADGAILSGDTGELLLSDDEATFTLTVNAENAPEHTYTLTVSRATSAINNPQIVTGECKIFPNPVKDDIFIKSGLTFEKVEIYTLTGTLLKQESNFNGKISVSELLQGIYLLKIYTAKGIAVSRIVKE